MARITRPKCRVCRRAGEKLFLKGDKCFTSKCPVAKRNFPPGMHGPTQGSAKDRKMTEFGRQMREKQKAKATYFILEKQFRRYIDRAIDMPGDTSVNLHLLLETRLDNVVYRLGLSPSRTHARQLVNHGHIKVNDSVVTIPSYQLSIGDAVTLTMLPKNPALLDALKTKFSKMTLPGWLTFDSAVLEGKVVSQVTARDVEGSFNAGHVIEFYSR